MKPAFRMVLWMAGTGIVSPACSSGGLDNSGGGAAGGATGDDLLCTPGLTRVCVGPGACGGGQKCDADGTWTDCDCGQGGSPATGGAANPSGGVTNAFGGWPSASGGVTDAFGGWPSASGGVATGGTPVFFTGGVPNPSGGRATGGVSYPSGGVAVGGTPVLWTGGVPNPSGGTANPSGGASTDGGPSTGGRLNVTAGGYVVGTGYHGYAWTASMGTGSTITPTTYEAVTSATQLCASGIVAAMSDYSGAGLLGINLNQNPDAGTESTYLPAGSSLVVNVTNSGGSPLRVQIQTQNGATDPNQRWCAPITQFNQDVTIPWTAFNSMCWDNSGTTYAGQALQALIILVPGNNSATTNFNFCLNALEI